MLAHSRGSEFIYESGGIMDFSQMWEFIRQTWGWCVVFSVCVIVGYCLWYHLFGRRIYKEIDGKLYIKEGIGEWEEIERHLDEKHHLNQS